MNPLTAMLAAQHLEELLREAESARRFRPERDSGRPSGPRRLLGRSALGLSVALGSVATRLDPDGRPNSAAGRLTRQPVA
jgi:hypothetical protein